MNKYYIILKWMLFIFLFSLFFSLIHLTPSKYVLNNNVIINFKENTHYSNLSQDYIREIATKFLTNRDTLSKDINMDLLEDLILEEKYVKKAEVYLDLAGSVNIFVHFREPFLRMLRNNQLYYYDSEGVLLPMLYNVDKNLLIISGDLNEKQLKCLSPLVNKIYDNEFLNKIIGGIYYDNKNGYVLSSRICDLGINIGKTPFLNKIKINMIALFHEFSLTNLDCDYCKRINIEYDKQIICIN